MAKKLEKNKLETTLFTVSDEWKYAKRLSVAQKQSTNLYEKMMYSHGYRINNRDYIYYNIPFYVNEDGETIFDENSIDKEGVFWDVIQKDEVGDYGTTYTFNRFTGSGSSDSDPVYVNVNLPQNIEEDYTINEIIDQKQLSFTDNKFDLELADDVKNNITKIKEQIKQQNEQGQSSQSPQGEDDPAQQMEGMKQIVEELEQRVFKSYNNVKKLANNHMRGAKWYPYSGWVYIPHTIHSDATPKGSIAFRKVDVTPFNLDIDPTKNTFDDADFINVSERITFSAFFKRVKSGEYSKISKTASKNVIEQAWNKESYYEFLPKSFPDAGLARDTSLRWANYSAGSGSNSIYAEEENAYGVIDYYYVRQLEGGIKLFTLLNGEVIGELNVDKYGIDTFPVVLFSESNDIRNNLDYAGNLAFRLLTSQLRIQINNKKIAETENDMEPVIVFQYIKDSTKKDSHRETTELIRGQGQNVYLIYSDKPESSNNSSKIDAGASYYTSYIRELTELKAQAQQAMKESAGITDFLAGTDSHSMESKQGLTEMVAAGLKAEADVVRSHSISMSESVTMDIFFQKLLSVVAHNVNQKTKSSAKPMPKLSVIMATIADIFTFTLESEYNKSQTNSIITNMLIPVTAQMKQPELLFSLIDMLPVTRELKEFIGGVEQKIQDLKQQELEQQKELASHQAQSQAQAQQQSSGESGGNNGQTKQKSSKTGSTQKKASNSSNAKKSSK